MKLFGDYHTHTKYSKFGHGKNTIAEMVEAGEKAELSEMAITDHAPSHIFGILKKNIVKARKEIDKINKDSKIKVLLGLECNLLGFDGENDLPKEYLDLLDIRLLGYHKICVGSFFRFINFSFNTWILKKSDLIERTTDAYIKAIKDGDFHFITHPQEYIKVDLKRLAEACEQQNTWLELNNRHFNYTSEEMDMLINQTNVKFIVNSDAHKIESVANVTKVFELIEKYKIPEDRIVNLNKLPVLKK